MVLVAEDNMHNYSKLSVSAPTTVYKQYKCPDCPSNSNSLEYFMKHIRQKHGEFNCTSCNYLAHTANQLKHHEKYTHSHEKPFNCTECDHKTKTKRALQAHMMYKHFQQERTTFKCPICPFLTYRRENLMKHDLTHDAVMKFRCHLCHYTARYSTKEDLDQHTEEKHTMMYCSQCEYETRNKSQLRRHMLRHCTVKPFNCSMCDRKFAHGTYLTNHIRKVHKNKKEEDDNKPYACQICSKRFIRWCGLKYHVKKRHGGVEKCTNCTDEKASENCKICDPKPFKCMVCGYATNNRTNLKQHCYIHDDVKPFQCEKCGKQFTMKANLQLHMKVHNKIPKQKKRKNANEED